VSHDGSFHTFYATVWCSGSCLKTFQCETQNLTTMECELHDKTTADVHTDPVNLLAVLQKNVYDWSTNQPTTEVSEGISAHNEWILKNSVLKLTKPREASCYHPTSSPENDLKHACPLSSQATTSWGWDFRPALEREVLWGHEHKNSIQWSSIYTAGSAC